MVDFWTQVRSKCNNIISYFSFWYSIPNQMTSPNWDEEGPHPDFKANTEIFIESLEQMFTQFFTRCMQWLLDARRQLNVDRVRILLSTSIWSGFHLVRDFYKAFKYLDFFQDLTRDQLFLCCRSDSSWCLITLAVWFMHCGCWVWPKFTIILSTMISDSHQIENKLLANQEPWTHSTFQRVWEAYTDQSPTCEGKT